MYLDKIIKHKRKELQGLSLLHCGRPRGIYDPVPFLHERPFIAEVKKASPSMGDINTAVDITAQAMIYVKGGAGAISVLTDKKYFKGSLDFLKEISGAVTVPVLRKDFIIDELQVENAFIAGADLILLIVCVLNEKELKNLYKKAINLGMKVLFEIHELDEFKKIQSLDLELVGINSRDLKTFKIDIDGALLKMKALKGDFMKIAESGINTAEDIIRFRQAGADAFLIGTALMKAESPADTLKKFNAALHHAD